MTFFSLVAVRKKQCVCVFIVLVTWPDYNQWGFNISDGDIIGADYGFEVARQGSNEL